MIIKEIKGGGIDIRYSEDEAKLSDEKFNNIINKYFERDKIRKEETTKRIETISKQIPEAIKTALSEVPNIIREINNIENNIIYVCDESNNTYDEFVPLDSNEKS